MHTLGGVGFHTMLLADENLRDDGKFDPNVDELNLLV